VGRRAKEKDSLRYIFVIVSVADLKAESVGAALPEEIQRSKKMNEHRRLATRGLAPYGVR